MSKIREFYVFSLVDTPQLANELNKQVTESIPADREVHFLQAISHGTRVIVFLRALEPRRQGRSK